MVSLRCALPSEVAKVTLAVTPGARVPDTISVQTRAEPPSSGTFTSDGGTILTDTTEEGKGTSYHAVKGMFCFTVHCQH